MTESESASPRKTEPLGSSFVEDTIISNNGLSGSGGGIVVQPAGSGSARVELHRTVIENNTHGLFANGAGSTGVIAVQVRDSVVTASAVNGISAFTAADTRPPRSPLTTPRPH